MVAIDYQVAGAIVLQPTIRSEAKEVIEALRQRGIMSVYMISGDHKMPTRKLAADLGVDQYFAEMLPEQKADFVEQLQLGNKSVCYIGDSINDAIALKKATVSISLRGASTVATDAAQVILMNQSLRPLGDLFDLVHDYQRHAKTTLIFVLAPRLKAVERG